MNRIKVDIAAAPPTLPASSMFNTATVIGVGVNVHGAGFPRNFVASFSEGSVAGGSVTLGKRFSRNFYAAYQRSISGTTGTSTVMMLVRITR